MKRKIAAIFAADIAGYSRLMAEDEEETRRLANAASGWSAVAVGAARRPSLGLKQASEQAAVNEALSDCAKRDSDCRVVAIGPFTVGPN